jgi:hypothetical protein
MSSEDQGRQYHGWFGHGTSGKADDARFGRIVYGAIGYLPAALRARWDGMLSRGPARRVVDVLRGVSEASGLSPSRFGALLPDTVGAIAADRLQAAGRAAASARTLDDERAASTALADAVQAVGFDNWSRFVANVDRAFEQRSADANTIRTAAAGEPDPENESRGLAEEFVDPLASARVAQFNASITKLRALDPNNSLLSYVVGPGYVPAQADIDQINSAIESVTIQRITNYILPEGTPIGQPGGGVDIRVLPRGVAGSTEGVRIS